jgi:hypothetical protein
VPAAPRSRLATAAAVFCALTAAFLVVRDLTVPEVGDVEVWFGFELRGALARWTAPLHWGIFALGAWGFWRAAPWITPAAAAYVFYVALSHLVWSEASPNGNGWPIGLLQAALFSLPAFLLLHAGRSERARAEGGP